MPYCTSCGSPNDDDARFCSRCGASLQQGYAGFWRRVAAGLLDALLLGAVTSVTVLASNVVGSVLDILMGWLYYALMQSSSTQATLGKMALGIRVTDMEGRRISFWVATGRYASKVLLTVLLVLPYVVSCLMIPFTARKQALHDMMVGTLVVKKGYRP